MQELVQGESDFEALQDGHGWSIEVCGRPSAWLPPCLAPLPGLCVLQCSLVLSTAHTENADVLG